MDVATHWDPTLRANRHSAPNLSSSSSSSSILSGYGSDISTSASHHHLHLHHHVEPLSEKKRSPHHCHLCGKRLLKLAKWRNYLTLPCRCRHVFCKQCITGRLQCRQRVMGAASFDLMWTFPCPGSAQCGQELNVDWSRGRRYSKNLVARDLGSADDSWEQEEEDEEEEEGEEAAGGSIFEEGGVRMTSSHHHCVGVCSNPSSSSSTFTRKSVSFDL
ncbi:hypothetical protein ACOMHN_007780 [Nucella lapillus]